MATYRLNLAHIRNCPAPKALIDAMDAFGLPAEEKPVGHATRLHADSWASAFARGAPGVRPSLVLFASVARRSRPAFIRRREASGGFLPPKAEHRRFLRLQIGSVRRLRFFRLPP